jgi:hypothetical protein
MRNLIEYPITPEEIQERLLELANDITKEERIGDIRPLILKTAAEVVKASEDIVKDEFPYGSGIYWKLYNALNQRESQIG